MAPAIPDLSIDAASTARILADFVEREVRRTGRDRVVVGLSGGLDSAVAATLAVRGLGAERVHAVHLPHRTSTAESADHARRVAAHLGVELETLEITPLVDAFARIAGEADRVRLGNVMSRVRMLLLYDRSAVHDALVLGTSNKTELFLGYGTLHGDLASALNPLGDLYKTQVFQLAEHLGVPAAVRTKPPSADLWPGQTDEDELGFTYADADRLLALLVDARGSRQDAIVSGFPESMVRRVVELVVRSQFKRRPPVLAKVSERTIGWDFRYPRDWLS